MGVTKDFCNTIVISEFEDQKYTQSAKYWVINTFKMHFSSLENIAGRIINNMQIKEQ